MRKKRTQLSPITILMIVIVIAAIATWLIPSGKYNTLAAGESHFTYHTDSSDLILSYTQKVLDSLKITIPLEKFQRGDIRKPVSVPGSFHPLKSSSQGPLQILEAPIKGVLDSIDIILFLLVLGGFMNVFHETGAMVQGLKYLSLKLKGRESWLIIILTFLFSFGGASFGMAEEALIFYPVLVPLFLAAGYDLLVPVAVMFGGTQLGTLSSFSNPFATIIASNAAGVNWSDGLGARVAIFAITTFLFIGFIVKYAQRVKKDPTKSWVYKIDGLVKSPYENIDEELKENTKLSSKSKLLLTLFGITFLGMIAGVVFFDWWLMEMTSIFLASALLIAIIDRTGENQFIKHFIRGAEGMLGVAFIIGVARGVTIVLNEGNIADSILFYSAKLVSGMPSNAFIIILLALFMVFTLFISSSSGMAVLTMPIIGGLAIIVGVPGREIVNTYLYGMGIMGFLTPTGLILPSLALVNVSIKAWVKFIIPFMILLFVICCIFLIVGIHFK